MSRIGEFPFPEGESVPDLLARAAPAFDAIVEAHAGEAVAIVAHGGPNRALLCRALGLPLSCLLALGQDYGALSVLEGGAEGWALRRLNETAMLQSARVCRRRRAVRPRAAFVRERSRSCAT